MPTEKNMKLEYSSAITNLTEVNPSFDKGYLRIAYTGKNRNNSFIGKDTFENAIPSMYGVPVVANYIREEDEIGSHDGEFVRGKNGELDYVNITQPVGFVPPQAQWRWEVIQDDGEIHQYLLTEVLLWKRQEAYSKIKENGITAQSMEINVTDGEMLDDYYQINEFYFTAFCLLGKAEPCFESAALFTFANTEDMQKQLNEMYEEFKLAFSDDFKPEVKKGGLDNMDKLKELLEKYQVNEEELSFEIEGLSDEELEAKFVEIFETLDEPVDEPTDEPADEPVDSFTLSTQIRTALSRSVREFEMVESDWGSYPRFYMVDYDEAVSEVYFEDALDEWNLYGATYSQDGDSFTIDFENLKRKKFSIVDYIEGTSEETFTLDIVQTVREALDVVSQKKYSILEEKFNDINKKHEELISQITKANAIEVLDKFEEKLSDIPEFSAIKSDIETNGLDCSLSELEDKLYALIGKKNFKYSPKSNKSPKVRIDAEHTPAVDQGPYGDLFNFMKK